MALTSPKMGLRLWDQLNDPYDHDQLADNWSKVDFHDHTPGRGVQIPAEGLADNAVTGVKANAELFEPWQYVMQGYATVSGLTTGTRYIIGRGSATAISAAVTGGIPLTYIDPADFQVPGKTVQFRFQVDVGNNSVLSGSEFDFQICPVTSVAGASGTLQATIGAGGMTVGMANPSASTLTSTPSPAFTLTAGYYVPTVTITTTMASGAVTWIRSVLQVRNT